MTFRYRDSCFTSFDAAAPKWHDSLTYLAYQQEKCPNTHKLHWQGFAQAKNPKASHKAWLKCLSIKKGHSEARQGTPQEASDYCTSAVYKGKDKGRIEGTTKTFGEIDLKTSEGQGKRKDLAEASAKILGKRRWQDVMLDPDLAPTVAKHMNWAKELFFNKPCAPKPFPHEKFYDWQQYLFDIVKEPCNDSRTIHWVYDPGMNKGKTEFGRFLMRNYGACILGGKASDVLYMYDEEPIAIFDIPKDVANTDKDFIAYAAIEKVKDGFYASGKYQGRKMNRDFDAHVIVFANCPPKENCWDPARTNLITLS